MLDPDPGTMIDRVISPWPVTVCDLTFRSPVEADIPALLAVRNLPEVNRFMVRTHVDPDELRREVLANRMSERDHTCVVERDGRVAATGFLDIVDGSGQPGAPEGMRRKPHEVQALWHAELGWLDEVGYAMLADEWRARS